MQQLPGSVISLVEQLETALGVDLLKSVHVDDDATSTSHDDGVVRPPELVPPVDPD